MITVSMMLFLSSTPAILAFIPVSSTKFSTMKRSSFILPPAVATSMDTKNYASFLNTLKMAGDADSDETKKSGAIYDDEVEDYNPNPLSNTMRDRLLAEASSGLDSNKSNTNVILYICVGVAILVAVGAQGILF